MKILFRVMSELGPWFTFGLAAQILPQPLMGLLLITVCIGEAVLGWRSLTEGNPLSWAILLAFLALAVNGYSGAVPWLMARRNAALLCYLTFALTAGASVVLGRPFSSHRARRQVPQEFWSHPLFLRINRRVSLVWAAAFVLDAIIVSCAAAASLATLLPCYTLLTGATVFSECYPAYARRRGAAPPAGDRPTT